MGRIFALPPSPWEVDHAAAYKAGVESVDRTGELPSGWKWLERRYDLNPLRFAANHPNMALLIDREHEMWPRPDHWPLDRCSPYQAEPCVQQQPPHGGGTNPQVVPEPAAIVSFVIGVGIAALALRAFDLWSYWRRAR